MEANDLQFIEFAIWILVSMEFLHLWREFCVMKLIKGLGKSFGMLADTSREAFDLSQKMLRNNEDLLDSNQALVNINKKLIIEMNQKSH